MPCLGGGSADVAAPSSPMQCRCPHNTYGILCAPCPAYSLCTAEAQTLTPLVSVAVAAWGAPDQVLFGFPFGSLCGSLCGSRFTPKGDPWAACPFADSAAIYSVQAMVDLDEGDTQRLYRGLVGLCPSDAF